MIIFAKIVTKNGDENFKNAKKLKSPVDQWNQKTMPILAVVFVCGFKADHIHNYIKCINKRNL